MQLAAGHSLPLLRRSGNNRYRALPLDMDGLLLPILADAEILGRPASVADQLVMGQASAASALAHQEASPIARSKARAAHHGTRRVRSWHSSWSQPQEAESATRTVRVRLTRFPPPRWTGPRRGGPPPLRNRNTLSVTYVRNKQPTSSPLAIPPDMKLRRVGNTLIVTIPKRVAEAMGWNEGDEVQVRGPSLSDGMEKAPRLVSERT